MGAANFNSPGSLFLLMQLNRRKLGSGGSPPEDPKEPDDSKYFWLVLIMMGISIVALYLSR